MKTLLLGSLLLSLALLPGARGLQAATAAHITAQTVEQSEVTLRQLTGDARGQFFGLRWKKAADACMATQANPGENPVWKALPSKICLDFRQALLDQAKQLEAENVPGKHLPLGEAPGMGVLKFSEFKMVANLLTSRECDATLTHCQEPELSAASRVGLLLRQVTTKQFGRLPVPASLRTQ